MQRGEPRCYICGRVIGLERHHVMPGVANRPLSEKFGLWIWLCHEHHVGKEGVQYNRELADAIKRRAQTAFEARHSHEEWMQAFGRNYLGGHFVYVYDDEDNSPMNYEEG